jgi:polyisoprenoid-binding protein YceI
MRMRRVSSVVFAGVAVTGLALSALAGDPPAEKSTSGKSLVVPEAAAKKGTVYYCLPEHGRQIHFVSDAPMEKIQGQSDKVIGYCIAGKDSAAALQGGEWHLPVKSLRTGRGQMEQHLASKQWLDAESFPEIVFALKSVKDLKTDEGKRSWTGTLEGEMTVHGVTKPITINDATIAMVPASDDAAKGVKGDLMAIRAKYPIKLSDYGVKNQNIGTKVSDELKLETSLYMSTVKPEDQPATSTGEAPKGESKKDADAKPKK